MRIGLVQMTSSDDPAQNAESARRAVRSAAAEGASFVLTPEVTNCVSASRERQKDVLRDEGSDATLAVLRDEAKQAGIWVLIGSLAVTTEEDRFANRSILIGPDGEIVARYDKIHMFDVAVSETETYRESAGYRPGDKAVAAQTPFGGIGLSICYDLRFSYLYRALAQAGADILTVPSAFSPVTGAAHWEPLLRARAIETGCFILAPAQTGRHEATQGRARETYGHGMVVAPWGEVLLDQGTEPGVAVIDIDLSQVEGARKRVPSLSHDRDFSF